MSIEQVIKENTDTMKQLIAVWTALTKQATSIKTQADTGEVTTVAVGGAVEIKVEAPKPAQPEAARVAPTVAAVTPTEQPTPESVTYEQVSKAITEKAKTDRAGVVALLTKFGAKKGTELKPEQYADFMKEVA